MPVYIVRRSLETDDPEWLVVDSRYDEDPGDAWIVNRHPFPEEAEAEAQRLNEQE